MITAVVFVPSRGISYLNPLTSSKVQSVKMSFRPLPGHILSQCYEKECEEKFDVRFRPLPGHILSQLSWAFHLSPEQSFRPLPGHILSQSELVNHKKSTLSVFVPSRGISYLNKLWTDYLHYEFSFVFVPSRGISYLNLDCRFHILTCNRFSSPPGAYLISIIRLIFQR